MAAASADVPLHTIPIDSRPPISNWIRATLFVILWDLGCIFVNLTQFLFVPLRVLPFPGAIQLYEKGISLTKASFGALCILMCQWIAPTKFIITCEGDLRLEDIVVRDPSTGLVTELRLPPKLIIMSNHQVYADWLYLWCLTYYMKSHGQVLIILKKSLKWIPIVGWGMQFYHFLFLARSWAADRVYLGAHLEKAAKRAQAAGEPLALMIFPEGTLVSPDTKPLSKKYADKMGIPDLTNALLPRSTGLLFLLRTWNPMIGNLNLLDVTIAYPGIPRAGYGQNYYTLRSIFLKGVPPPTIHLHLRMYNVDKEVPIGNVGSGVGRGAEASPEEAKVFDEWLRERWTEKDNLIDSYHETGGFVPSSGGSSTKANGTRDISGSNEKAVEIPVELRSNWEILDAFSFLAPVLAYSLVMKFRAWYQGRAVPE